MDVQKMKGIIEALEAESRQPLPSHSNLARLTASAFTEVMGFLDTLCKGVVPLLVKQQIEDIGIIQSHAIETGKQQAPSTDPEPKKQPRKTKVTGK